MVGSIGRLVSKAVSGGPRLIVRKVRTAAALVRTQGAGAAYRYARTKLARAAGPQVPTLLVALEDAAAVDWTTIPDRISESITVESGSARIAWIMSPPGRESGGHQNLFRFIEFAERAGHDCRIYLYQADDRPVDVAGVRAMLAASEAYPTLRAPIEVWNRERGVADDTQAIFATGWETAYPSFLDRSHAKRLYFVQDFEPSFYPVGSESILAENTYRFGFHAITAGGWLAHKLRDEYGMAADHFDFAVDTERYRITNDGPRNEIFFYARPVTPRRGFELGLLVLNDFAKLRPDVTINLAGWDVSNWRIPFAHRNLASLQLSELNEVYNRCAAGLVMSLSNMSLLPLELMSSGVTPVVNDGPNNRMVSDNPYIEYVPSSPLAIARKLVEVVERPDAVERSRAMSESVRGVDWAASGDVFVKALEGALRG
ncbi:rhamnosyltransferase WsaF family glycosyltransferase [Agromyces larvae]|uniref:Glycosyltransferase family 1 protein n=1 Tax=Agromyces larvae TaxID=2929802 RepID=A0ABY4BZZ2_9MICO|nr:glycosyltransferase family 1 protein [Agromyces larvae]UOE44484.1 glycosyltransferase family 1 protein [Agromyces larvae]